MYKEGRGIEGYYRFLHDDNKSAVYHYTLSVILI